MAQRLSFDWSESVTIGRAVADWLALRKGESLGLLDADVAAERAAREETDELPTRVVEIMVRSVFRIPSRTGPTTNNCSTARAHEVVVCNILYKTQTCWKNKLSRAL